MAAIVGENLECLIIILLYERLSFFGLSEPAILEKY